MKQWRSAGLAFIVLAAGCASFEPTSADFAALGEAQRPESKEALIEPIMAKMKKQADFYDPYSLRVELEVAALSVGAPISGLLGGSGETRRGWFVCGTYNAKNRMGGYVGAKPFYALLDRQEPTRIVEVNDAPLFGSPCGQFMDHAREVVDLETEDFTQSSDATSENN